MASTEQRTGFRFGWGSRGDSEKSASQENGSSATDSSGESADEAAGAAAPMMSPADAPTEPSNGDHVDPEAPSTDASETPAEAPQSAPAAPEAWPVSDTLEPSPSPAPAEPRATGFLADLMRAMQAAADQNRKQVTDRFREDGRALIDSVRSRAAEDLNELRRAADGDLAAVREWSKGEIARIKAETDERIATRKAELDRQLEDHGALIDREVEKVEARIASFEQQMEGFFARLQNVGDPTTFAAVAQEMPNPPSVETLGAQARAEALAEVSLGGASLATIASLGTAASPAPSATGSEPYGSGVDSSAPTISRWSVPATETAWETGQSVAPSAESGSIANERAPSAGTTADRAPADGTEQPVTEASGAAGTSDPAVSATWGGTQAAEAPSWTEPTPGADPWTQPASTTPADQVGSSLATSDEYATGADAARTPSLVYGAPAPLVAEALGSSSEVVPERSPGDRTAGSWPSSYEADPRLAALGIDGPQGAALRNIDEQPAAVAAQDPWSAPAAESVPASTNDTFAMPGEAFGSEAASSESPAARLAGLVPSSELPANGRTSEISGQPVPTQVVVTGLMSVASIASFKRHLSRVPGVQGVGVSSGPDGEFIFKTTHEPGVALADVIPTLPGFGAEVVNSAEGTINVAAHDPEADA